jgi:predicted DNA binding CopG/RHH family protein
MEVPMARKIELDAYEKSVESELDRYVSVSGSKRQKIEAILEGARKSRTINIRINQMDLDGLKRSAQEEGIPYQTLITSVLHKYLSGRLIDERHVRKSVELLTRRRGS